ncbi:GNAT family N-acetyltransferase [Fredinandcohnia humi]
MRIERLTNDRIKEFIKYCEKHRIEVDESFLYDEDLKSFEVNEENPTYVITDDQNQMIAVASLMMDEYAKRGKKARFRIFHSEFENSEYYKQLMQAIMKHTNGLEKIFIFVPVENRALAGFIEELEFAIERYSYLLVRNDIEVPEFKVPSGYDIRPFRIGYDEEAWSLVRNESFATLRGSETPITPEMVTKMMSAGDSLEGGAMILYHHDRPIGVVRGADDEYEGNPIMNIGPIAIIPEYQGKGLGRCLLRASLQFAKKASYERTILCVNAENERAKSLYIQEGFVQVEAVACYTYKLG